MALNPEFRDHLIDLLTPLGAVTVRAMFGGGGVYLDGTMFGLVADDVLYLKVDDANRPDFEAAGSGPFVYQGKNRPVTMSYYQVPAELMDDGETLCQWARGAWEAARRARSDRSR